MRKFAISDIHGCALTFKALLDEIGFSTNDELYLLGDYIDRGPDSKGVIDHIFELKESGYTVVCLKGNHEELLLESLNDSEILQMWLDNGGENTLNSYKLEDASQLATKYMDFFKHLKYYVEVDNYLLVHAGFNFSSSNFLADFDACLWQRHWYHEIDYKALGDRIIVHGHTPIKQKTIQQHLAHLDTKQYLDIDNGSCYIKHSDKGLAQLCAFDMTNRQLYFQKNIDEG